MTVSTFTFATSDNAVKSTNATWTTAQSGGTMYLESVTAQFRYSGDWIDTGLYNIIELFFCTADMRATIGSDVVSAAELSFWLVDDTTEAEFDIEARTKDWGAAVDTGDWVAQASVTGQTLLAKKNTADVTYGQQNVLTNEGTALIDAINTALAGDGILRTMMVSSLSRGAGAPTTLYRTVRVEMADHVTSSHRPKLTVTHAPAVGNVVSPIPGGRL